MYREEDIDILKLNIGDIQEKAFIIYKTNYEPTYEESKNVYKYILEFIKEKKRIVYGGYAQNLLIKIKNPEDAFYKDIQTPDIEFYSFDPLTDLVNLCDFLYEKGFKYIQGSEGIHSGTYKLFINFINYCDISYMPKNIFDNCPIIKVDNLLITHPTFMYVDFFRVFTDPMTSYWRLDKSFFRYIKLYKHYPINFDYKLEIENNPNLDIIRKKLLHNSDYIIIGNNAYNYYASKLDKNELINNDYYEIIMDDYKNEIKKINNKLNNLFSNNITHKEYSPYFDFWDNKTEFFYNDKLLLRVYGNNYKCIVFKKSDKKKLKYGTHQLVLLYFLINYTYYLTNRNKAESDKYLYLFYKLNNIKNKYLEINNRTVLDNTPFQEFTFTCHGETMDTIRKAMIERQTDKKNKFKYIPSGKTISIPNYKFFNTSGNEILNEKYLVLKK